MICYFSGPSRVLELFVPAGGGHGSAALSFSLTLWGQNPKPEGRRPKSRKAGRNPKPETQNGSGAGLSFGFRASGFFRRKAAWRPRRYTRISDFDLRIYATPTTC